MVTVCKGGTVTGKVSWQDSTAGGICRMLETRASGTRRRRRWATRRRLGTWFWNTDNVQFYTSWQVDSVLLSHGGGCPLLSAAGLPVEGRCQWWLSPQIFHRRLRAQPRPRAAAKWQRWSQAAAQGLGGFNILTQQLIHLLQGEVRKKTESFDLAP